MSQQSETADVLLTLSGAEALVLFELLSRFEESGKISIEDKSESRALWNVHALLQKTLLAPLQANYLELLGEARDRLRDPDE